MYKKRLPRFLQDDSSDSSGGEFKTRYAKFMEARQRRINKKKKLEFLKSDEYRLQTLESLNKSKERSFTRDYSFDRSMKSISGSNLSNDQGYNKLHLNLSPMNLKSKKQHSRVKRFGMNSKNNSKGNTPRTRKSSFKEDESDEPKYEVPDFTDRIETNFKFVKSRSITYFLRFS